MVLLTEGEEDGAAGAADEGALGAAVSVAGFATAGALVPGGLASDSFELVAAPVLPPRKSVTYQPEPFKAKPAAVTCLARLSVLQAGHSVSGESLILRKVSCAWLQALQR